MVWNDLERDEFYRTAIRPEFPNQMKFVLDRPDDVVDSEHSFSQDGIDSMVEQIKTFILARTLGTWNGTGSPPQHLTVSLALHFQETTKSTLRGGSWPWWQLVDKGDNPLEGSHRASAGPE